MRPLNILLLPNLFDAQRYTAHNSVELMDENSIRIGLSLRMFCNRFPYKIPEQFFKCNELILFFRFLSNL
jgi:RNase P/RNase MRP subunit p30